MTSPKRLGPVSTDYFTKKYFQLFEAVVMARNFLLSDDQPRISSRDGY